MSSWEKFMKKYSVNPLTLFDPSEPRVTPEKAQERLVTCLQCDKFLKVTRQCRECWCFMPAKVILSNAECPINKWGKE
jgi:hypothetical protein